jgi:PAS domain S-box-containing protein
MYKLIADSSFSWEYVRGDDGFSYVSPSCARMTGYAPEEFLARPGLLEEIVHRSLREALEEHLREASRGGEPVRLKLRLTCQNGSDCWVEHTVMQIHDAQGRYAGLRGSFRDIMQHRDGEQRRKSYEKRYRVMAEHQADVVCCWLPDTTLTFVNEAYCRLTGKSETELLGRPWLSLIPPDAREKVRVFYEALAAAPRVSLYEHEVTGADGRTLWMQWVDAPIFDEAGDLLEFQSTGRDITAHRKALMDLQDSEERFRTFMSHLPALAFIKDERSRVLFTNRAMNELMGSEDWVGRDALQNLPEEVAAKILEQDRQVIEGGKPVLIEEAIPVKSGETRIFETRKFPIGREGKPPLLGAIALDVTEKRRAEEALLASEERYRLLAEASRDFIFVLDRDDRFVYVNSASENVTGKKPAELIGRKRASLDVPPEMLARQKEANETVFAGGEPLFVEGQFLMGKGGRPAWHNVTLVPLKNGSGEVHALLGVARDVTESRERAQRLEEANVALKVLLRHREEDRRELEERFLANFRKLIMPSLEKLRKTGLTPRQAAYVDVVEMNVRKVFSASGAAAGLVQASLTPIETRIVAFIQEDKTNKEIGSLLNLSPRTVEYYRDRIRKKLGLKGKNVSLRSYLYSLS